MEVINFDFFFNFCWFYKYKYYLKLEWLDLYWFVVKIILNKKFV